MSDLIATIADKVASDAAESLSAQGVNWDDKAIDKLRDWIANAIQLRFEG